jgi:hemolysin-activating ACP:hemolysin acyltransferase
MTTTEATEAGFAEKAAELLKSLDKSHVGAAMSKMISASIGDIVVVMSRTPAYKFHALADIEWLVLPAVLSGQYYVAEMAHPEHGLRAPVGCVTWASVSDEVSARLAEGSGPATRLKPDEWTSGPHLWLIDAVGEPRVLAEALRMLVDTRFKENPARISLRDAEGGVRVETVQGMLAARAAPQEAGL